MKKNILFALFVLINCGCTRQPVKPVRPVKPDIIAEVAFERELLNAVARHFSGVVGTVTNITFFGTNHFIVEGVTAKITFNP